MYAEKDDLKELLKKIETLEGKVADYEEKEKAMAEEKEKNVFLDEYVANVPDYIGDRIKNNKLDATKEVDRAYLREIKAIKQFWADLKKGNQEYEKNQKYIGQLLGKNALEMRYEVYRVLGKV